MFRYISGCLASLVLLSGCASTERLQQRMDSYIGQPISRVQEAFGYDYTERTLGNGDKAYIWQWSRQGVTSGPNMLYSFGWSHRFNHGIVALPGFYYTPSYYEYSCEFTFTVDAQERVRYWRALGEGCTHYRPTPVLRSQNAPKAG